MKCKQCGADLEEGSVFCANCGAKCENEGGQGQSAHQSPVFCPNCGQQMEWDSVFCPNCGQPVGGQGQPEKKNLKKLLIPVAAAVVLAAVVGIGVSVFGGSSGSKSKNDEIYNKEKLLYVKDDSLYYSSLKKLKKDPAEYTDEIREDDLTYGFAGVIPHTTAAFTKDGKYCFYPERLDSDGRFRLMRKQVGKKKDAEKVDNDVTGFILLNSGGILFKKDNDALYVWDGKDKTKIASDVSSYRVSKDKKSVLWTVKEGEDSYDLYYQKLGKKSEKKKLEGDIASLEGCNDDFSIIYFLKNDAVYRIKKQGDKEKLAGDILKIRGLDVDEGTFFYIQEAENGHRAEDFVTDDISQEENSYYYDNLREDLKEREISIASKELYYFDGKEKTLVCDSVSEVRFSTKGCVIYTSVNMEDLPRILLSEISYAGDVEDIVRNALLDGEVYLAAGKETAEIESDGIQSVYSDRDKKLIYALNGQDEDGNDLISINWNKNKLGEVKTIDEDVEAVEGVFGGSCYYYKDIDRDHYSGDLYRDGELVLSDVALKSMVDVPGSSSVVCITDGSSSRHKGTLTMLKGDKDINIGDDVSFFDVIGEKAVVMLTDYNFDRRRGELKYFQGKEAKEVDSDVSGFYRIGNGGICP